MSIVYLNGRYLPRREATVDIEDRGFMFGDGVYEVVHYYNGFPLAMEAHVDRMLRSIERVGIDADHAVRALAQVSDELVRRNHLPHCRVYWQVTRGVAVREHAPPPGLEPTVMVICYRDEPLDFDGEPMVVHAIAIQDIRWHRCAIKSVMLLPNVLGKRQAIEAGAYEAIQHRDGIVTEGCSTNVFAVRNGALWTHPADQWILGGITRDILLGLARQRGIVVHEAPFDVDALRDAEEVFLSGTVTHIAAVTRLDGEPVGGGHTVGAVTRMLHKALMAHIQAACR